MSMMDKRKCLLCGHYQVYAEHITKDEKVEIGKLEPDTEGGTQHETDA